MYHTASGTQKTDHCELMITVGSKWADLGQEARIFFGGFLLRYLGNNSHSL